MPEHEGLLVLTEAEVAIAGAVCERIFPADANGPGASHVGIATSASTVISATTHGVREHAIGGDYWGTHYYGARRF